MKESFDRAFPLRFGRRLVLALLLLAATSGTVLTAVAPADNSEPQAQLELSVDNGVFGIYELSLLCNPDGGTAPDPAAACAALELQPELVTTQPLSGQCGPTGCGQCGPGPLGDPSVQVTGTFAGKQVSTTLSCSGGTVQLALAWVKILQIPKSPLQLEAGRSFTKQLVLSSGKAGVQLRYRKGAGFAMQFPLENIGSVPITVTGAGSRGYEPGEQWPTPADPYPGRYPHQAPAPQLLALIGLQLAPASPGDGLTPPALAPPKSGRRTPYTIQPGATVWIQENFAIGECNTFKPGRRYIYNKEIVTGFRVAHHGSETFAIDLPGYQIAITCPR